MNVRDFSLYKGGIGWRWGGCFLYRYKKIQKIKIKYCILIIVFFLTSYSIISPISPLLRFAMSFLRNPTHLDAKT